MDQTTLNELLECSVCMEVLDVTSKVLPCQHTFCRRCLDEIVATKKHLQCPECRMPVNKRVEDLPSNILLVRLLETMKTMANRRTSSSSASASNAKVKESTQVLKKLNRIAVPDYPCAKALYNYDAQETGDLTFKKGNLVRLCRQIDENWFLGELKGQQGYFPATYVEVLTPLPDEVPTCKALYDFIINDNNEKDCLNFHKGEIITVIRCVDENWAEGRLADRIGIFPMSFVEMNDSAKYLICQPELQSANRRGVAMAAASSVAINRATTTTTTPSSSSSPTSSVFASGISDGNPTLQPLPTAATMEAMKAAQPMMTHPRPSVEAPVANVDVTTSNVPASRSLRTKPFPLIYEALYNYKPLKEDEIELKKGECYTVSQKCQDGWFKGRSLISGLFGIFPGNYVKQIALMPVDDLTMVQQSDAVLASSSSSSNHSPAGRGLPIGTNRHLLCSSSSKQTTSRGDGDGGIGSDSSAAASDHVPRSRPITNITQAQLRNANNCGNAITTTADSARYLYLHRGGGGLGATGSSSGGTCPTWLNLISSHHSPQLTLPDRTNTGSNPASSRSGHRVQRSATCRARSATRAPPSLTVAAANDAICVSDCLDAEDLRMMLRGLSVKEMNDPNVESSQTNRLLSSSDEGVVASGTPLPLQSPAETDKMEKRFSFVKRLTGSMAKVKKSSSVVEHNSERNGVSGELSTIQPRSVTLPVKPLDASHGSEQQCQPLQQNNKPMKMSLMKVLPISLSSVQTKPAVANDMYRCIVPYPPQSDNELELKVGDIVYVVRKRDDGWFRGVLQRTGKVGLFPASFVQTMSSSVSS